MRMRWCEPCSSAESSAPQPEPEEDAAAGRRPEPMVITGLLQTTYRLGSRSGAENPGGNSDDSG